MEKADTDTVASLMGGLFGALYGTSWLPIELRQVQDYNVFEILVTKLIEGQDELTYNSRDYKLFTKDNVCSLKIGEQIEVLPFGKIELLDIRSEQVYLKDMYANTYLFITEYEQTLYVSKVGKKPRSEGINIKSENSVESDKNIIYLDKEKMKLLGEIFKKIDEIEDFIEIVYKLLSILEVDDNISKEDWKDIRERWKKYKITKKQIAKACSVIK